ncbi:MAG: AAA family ATPase [Polyangiaceae bacterium]
MEAAAKDKLLVITGGPGVGKTTIVRAILGVLGRAKLSVRLAAPTGRAAKRMAEATGHDASTIHRLLEFDPRSGAFPAQHRAPIQADALVVDEASMIDVGLAAALLSAVPSAARLVIVGDADQLQASAPARCSGI